MGCGGVVWRENSTDIENARMQSRKMWRVPPLQSEIGYQLMIPVLLAEAKLSKSSYLVPEWKFMRWFDGNRPCGAEEMPPGYGISVWVVEEGGEISKYHHRMCPTAIGSRYGLAFLLRYD